MPLFLLDPLEDRRLLAWGTYPQLIQQALASTQHPSINGIGINVAVIDSGVDFSQPYLTGKFWANPGEIAGNNIDDDGNGYKDDIRGWDFFSNDNNPEDQNGHGTAISGIIAANKFTYAGATYGGLAPGVKLIELKVADPTGAYSFAFAQRVEKALQWVEANYAQYNIRVVNMSVWTPQADYNTLYDDEVARLTAAGVFIAAAGNQLDPNQDVSYPAADPAVFGVSVVKANNTFPVDTVNRGPGIDLLAPGDGVPILLRGGGIGTSALATSYSTPFATAAAALVRQVKSSFTPTQIANILKDSGDDVTDTSVGYTHSGRTYSRLNVMDALDLAYERGAPIQAPFWGKRFAINARIQVEDYDEGGEAVAYHDTDAVNSAQRYRLTGVDTERTADTGGGYDVTLAKPGEWLEYTLNVTASTNYQFVARVAAKSKGGTFHVEVDGVNKSGPITIPKTGSWQVWTNVVSPTFALTAGTHVIRIAIDANNATGNGAGNFNWFALNSVSAKKVRAAFAAAPVVLPKTAAFSPAKISSEDSLLRDGEQI